MEPKPAKYCFDDEFFATSPVVEVAAKYAPCAKCGTRKTLHRTQVCADCRRDTCLRCGRSVIRSTQRKRCHSCDALHSRKLGRVLDVPNHVSVLPLEEGSAFEEVFKLAKHAE